MNTNSEKDWSNIEHEVHSTNPFSYTKIPITTITTLIAPHKV